MKIMSEFVKKKIKKRSFSNEKDRNYIHALLDLERFVLKGDPSDTTDALMLHQLTEIYPKEFAALFKELDPKGHESFLEWKIKLWDMLEKKKRHKRGKKEQREYEKERKQWLALGGKE